MKIKTFVGLSFSIIVAACGGGNGDGSAGYQAPVRVVSFGDSLSDVGTYNVRGSPPVGPAQFSGGRYTTNPGLIWTELVARHYGDILSPASLGGFGMAPRPQAGFGYAQGGARVSKNISINFADVLAMPVAAQVGEYLGANGRFNAAQVILVQGGGNDVINNVLAAYDGVIDPEAVPALVSRAAADLAEVVDRIVLAGGEKIVLVNLPDIGNTPLAAGNADLSQDLSSMSALFNQVLLRQVNQAGAPRRARPLVLVDAYGWTNERIANYRLYGFKASNQDVACSTPKIVAKALSIGLANPLTFLRENGSALLCANDTLTEARADQTFMFADELHPSTRMHELFGDFVLQRMASEGI